MNLSELRDALGGLITVGDANLEQTRLRLASLCDLFLERYGEGPVLLLRAPARINVLGEHIDYVSYFPTASLTFGSRERDALMLYRSSGKDLVQGVSTYQELEPASFRIDQTNVPMFVTNLEGEWLNFLHGRGNPRPHWQNYVEGAVTFAKSKFGERITKGFDFCLDSNIPAGGGASSSSALVVLGGAAIREANQVPYTPHELARDSALAEWFIGTRGGSMDHTTICLAQPAKAVRINYSNSATKCVALPDRPFAWLTFFTHPAEKGREAMIAYNERAAVSRLLIPAIIHKWRFVEPERHFAWTAAVQSYDSGSLDGLSQAENLVAFIPEAISIQAIQENYPETFEELERSFPALLNQKSIWPLKLQSRARHHLGEVRRVALATRTLESIQTNSDSEEVSSKMAVIGRLLDASHESLRDLYEVSTPEVEQLLGVMRSDPQVLGARLMGGGFGGNVLALTTRDHSEDLIAHVQQEYYAPRRRDGVGEGSVMVSTPGHGLSRVELNELWRDSIVNVNSLGSDAAANISRLGSIIDSIPSTIEPRNIWPVIVAAGKGTRAAETGIATPKPLALVNGKPAIVHVLRNIQKGLGQTRPPVLIVSPENEAAIRNALRGEEVFFVKQPTALGTGDAVLSAHKLMRDFAGFSLVVWSTQPVIRPRTFFRTAKLARLFEHYEMMVPTAFQQNPYAPLQRGKEGEVQSAVETHLESAQSIDFGETNIGMFLLKNQTMFVVLSNLRHSYWDETAKRYRRSRGELGFPNEVIHTLAQANLVFASPFADPREEQGIKTREDLSRCETYIAELEDEEHATDGKGAKELE